MCCIDGPLEYKFETRFPKEWAHDSVDNLSSTDTQVSVVFLFLCVELEFFRENLQQPLLLAPDARKRCDLLSKKEKKKKKEQGAMDVRRRCVLLCACSVKAFKGSIKPLSWLF